MRVVTTKWQTRRACELFWNTNFSHPLTHRGQTIEQLKYRLQPNASDLQAAAYMVGVIKQSFLNFRTAAYDRLQYMQNDIPY